MQSSLLGYVILHQHCFALGANTRRLGQSRRAEDGAQLGQKGQEPCKKENRPQEDCCQYDYVEQ